MNDAPNQADTPQPVYTPPAIKGYRKLTQAELDDVNFVKAIGEDIEARIQALGSQLEPRALALALDFALGRLQRWLEPRVVTRD